MRFPEKGRPAEALLAELRARKHADVPWPEGRVFAYIYQADAAATRLVHDATSLYLTENGLDPASFPSMLALERDVISMALDLANARPGAVGSFTSGGTESVLLSVKTARDHAREHRPEVTRPALVLPETAHPAFFKACAYFDVRAVRVPVDAVSLCADVQAIEAAIDADTIMLAASAPSYAHGVIDPIAQIGEVAQRHRLLFHVDGCIGGMYLPFLRRLGHDIVPFDLSVPGVTQLSLDFHKFGYAAKGASSILYNDAGVRRHQIFVWSGWPGYAMVNPTMLSARSGGPLAGAWAILNYMGAEGYLRAVETTQSAVTRIREGIGRIEGLRVLGDPPANLLAFAADGFDVYAVAEEMRARRWYVQPQLSCGASPPSIHLSIGISNAPHVEAFLADLRASAAAARVASPAFSAQQIDALLPAANEPAAESLAALVSALKPDAEGLPTRMRALNTLLDRLPAEQRDRLFVEFTNQLYGAR
jgi:sphinganine-1-phosphate aldolase